jgi:hypothetical protein
MPTIRQMIKAYSEMKNLDLPPKQIEELIGYQIYRRSEEKRTWFWKNTFKLFNWIDEKKKLSSRH